MSDLISSAELKQLSVEETMRRVRLGRIFVICVSTLVFRHVVDDGNQFADDRNQGTGDGNQIADGGNQFADNRSEDDLFISVGKLSPFDR